MSNRTIENLKSMAAQYKELTDEDEQAAQESSGGVSIATDLSDPSKVTNSQAAGARSTATSLTSLARNISSVSEKADSAESYCEKVKEALDDAPTESVNGANIKLLQDEVDGTLNYVSGVRLDTNGAEVADENYCTSNKIAIDKASLNGITFYFGTYDSNIRLVEYNESDEKVDTWSAKNDGNEYRLIAKSSIHDATAYVRFCYPKGYVGRLESYNPASVLWQAGVVGGLVNRVSELEEEVIGSVKVTNLLPSGYCNSLDDFSISGRTLSLIDGGGICIKDEGVNGYQQLNMGSFAKTIGHKYAFVAEVSGTWGSFLFYCGANTSTDVFKPTTNQARTIYGGFITATDAYGTMYLQCNPKGIYKIYGFILIDCGVEGDDLYNKDISYFIDLYKSVGVFDTYSLDATPRYAEQALSLIESEQNYSYIHSSKLVKKDYTFGMIGDSITYLGFSNNEINTLVGWIVLAAKELGIDISHFSNYGWNGNRLSYYADGTTPDDPEGQGTLPMSGRIDAMGEHDLYFILGGTNDISSMAEKTAVGSKDAPYDKTTIFGAVGSIIQSIRHKVPYAKVVFATPIRRADTQVGVVYEHGASINQIVDAIKEACTYFGVPCIDLYNTSGINHLHIQSNTNLLDGLAWTENADIDSSGNVISGSYYVTPLFSIDADKTYYCNKGDVYEYDADGTFLDSVSFSANAGNKLSVLPTCTQVRYKVASLEGGTISGSTVNLRFADIAGDYISDGVHPNALGMRLLAKRFAEEIKKYIADENY